MSYHSGSLNVRRMAVAAFAMLMAVTLMMAAGANSAEAKKKAKKAKVTLKVTTKNQAALLKANKLTVKVKSTAKAKVKLSVAVGGKSNRFKKKTVKFKKKGTKTIKLAFAKNGRKALATCGAKTVTVKGAYKKGKKNATAKTKKKLAKSNAQCGPNPPPIDYTTVPLGDNPERCDFLDTTVCLHPFPNDYYTVPAETPTGKKLNIQTMSAPANIGGVNIDMTDQNRADGFSPGNLIVLKVPGLDTQEAFDNSGLVPISDLRAYDDPSQAVIVINADTGERQPIWAELDSNPTAVDPSIDGPGGIGLNPTNTDPVNLIIRPAKNFDFGERYIVAFRNLKDAGNQTIPAPTGFRVYRDNEPTQQEIVEDRRPHMESVISDLVSKAGVERSSLYMAWDFTIASQDAVTGRALEIRDDAFERLGDTNLANKTIEGDAPEFTINSVTDPGGSTLIRIEGTLDNVPCYLNQDGCPTGSTFDFDSNGNITWNPTFTVDVPFRCNVPETILDTPGEVTPTTTGTYGHGLLGSLGQVNGQDQFAAETNSTWCAVDWAGFSDSDLPSVISALTNMSNFPKMVDRMQQGFVNFLYLQRALIHPDGFASDSAFQYDNGSGAESVIDLSAGVNTRGYYMGISQGGIMGGALIALSPDADRGVLGVPGMNYSTLLRRSVDSDEYFKIAGIGLYANYPNEEERPLLLSLIQLLWDRGEANGYAHNMTTNPLPNTPPHSVLQRNAFGDHQVANVTSEVMARTNGAAVYSPALNPGRHWEADPFMDLPEVSSFPYTGGNSMMVYYDGGPVGYFNNSLTGPGGVGPSECNHGNPVADPCEGSGTPPNENLPPREEWGFGDDPHAYPRRSVDGISHGSTFLYEDGRIEACRSGSYCYSNNYNGPTP